MKLFKTLAIILTCAGLSLCAAHQSFAQTQTEIPIQKKVIQCGWDMPDTATLRQNMALTEKMPFDGVILKAHGKTEAGKIVSSLTAFSSEPWKREWFQSSVDDLKAIHSKNLTDNFIRVGSNPGNVDWFDDAGWEQIVDHMRIVAWIAKEGNLKGIVFDPEAYTKPYRQFKYTSQAQHDKHTFEEYQIKARQRGREIINVVASVDPNLMFLTFFMTSHITAEAKSNNPQTALQLSDYNLYPAFINGWLDVAPPSMIFVDGSEGPGYRANDQLQFLQAANFMRGAALNLIAPENRQKYRAQVQVGFGIYLDSYTNPPTSSWYMDPKGVTPVQRLQINIQTAANTADEYVWLYGEKYHWWPTENRSVNPQHWEDVLPGIGDALLSATQPLQVAQRKIADLQESGQLMNLLKNGDFSAVKSNTAADQNVSSDWKSADAPPNWSTWQDSNPPGILSLDNTINHSGGKGGSGILAGTKNGTLIQQVEVEAGGNYLIRAWTRQVGSGNISIRVGWQNAEGKWIERWLDEIIVSNSDIPKKSWQLLENVVKVPANATKLVVLLSVKNQLTAQDKVWFDDAQVYQIP